MLIALSGKKHSGKDTAGLFFTQNGYMRLAFADALKDICKILYDLSEEQLNGNDKEKIDLRYNKTPRELLQFIGTLLRQNIGKNVWSDIIKNKLFDTKGQKIVITDLRYPDELEIIKSFGGIIINIFRPNLEENEFNKHESEQQKLSYDYQIINDSSISDLHSKLFVFLSR